MSYIVYDCEIEKAILGRNEQKIAGILYCEGWRDFANMGISVITAFDLDLNLPRIFLKDNFQEFKKLVDDPRNKVCGFNNRRFDDQLVAAYGITSIPAERSVDLLEALWIANGLNPDQFIPTTHGGYGLDACAKINLGIGKTSTGALAPIEWQRGNFGNVIDYCMRDTMLTVALLRRALEGRFLDPKRGILTSLQLG